MTSYISAKEWELLSFFEVEPTKVDADIAWPYNDFTYRKTLGDLHVTFSVAPACMDFTLTVRRGDVKQLELTALSVFDIRYHNDGGTEWLEILVTEHGALELRLKPAFSLTGSLKHA